MSHLFEIHTLQIDAHPLTFLWQAVSSSASPNKLLNSEPSKEKENEDALNESSSGLLLQKSSYDLSTLRKSLTYEKIILTVFDAVSDFNSEFDSSFTTIDLRSPTPNRNRRSSTSSDLFPIYEFLPTRHNLQVLKHKFCIHSQNYIFFTHLYLISKPALGINIG